MAAPASGLVFVLSGPSGVGKDTIKRELQTQRFRLGYCVTVTTRERRATEEHGVDYRFVSVEEFIRLKESGGLLEHAVVHGKDFYGIPADGLRDGLRSGDDVLITPDVQGAATLREKLPAVITIFLAPTKLEFDPATGEVARRTLQELRERIESRGAVSEEELERRLTTAVAELKRQKEFDYVVVNERDRLPETVDKIKAIIVAERCRVNPCLVSEDDLLRAAVGIER